MILDIGAVYGVNLGPASGLVSGPNSSGTAGAPAFTGLLEQDSGFLSRVVI